MHPFQLTFYHISSSQQLFGGGTVVLLERYMRYGDVFSILSHRSHNDTFGVAVIRNGIHATRWSQCCEYHYHLGKRCVHASQTRLTDVIILTQRSHPGLGARTASLCLWTVVAAVRVCGACRGCTRPTPAMPSYTLPMCPTQHAHRWPRTMTSLRHGPRWETFRYACIPSPHAYDI